MKPTATPDPVVVTSDIAFADAVAGPVLWSKPLLDLYAPSRLTVGQASPLVVILPAHNITKDVAHVWAYVAKALVLHGAVVAVANWSQLEEPQAEFTDGAVLARMAGVGQSVAACAIATAADLGVKAGADPARLVVVGELYGANAAAMAVLGTPSTLPGCKSTSHPSVRGLVPVDADWLAAFPAWDTLGKQAHQAVNALAPWALLAKAPALAVEVVMAGETVTLSKRCGGQNDAWLASRDPGGSLRKLLAKAGAFGDGCVDLADSGAALQLASQGSKVKVALLRQLGDDLKTAVDASGQLTDIGLKDLALLDWAILTAAGLEVPWP